MLERYDDVSIKEPWSQFCSNNLPSHEVYCSFDTKKVGKYLKVSVCADWPDDVFFSIALNILFEHKDLHDKKNFNVITLHADYTLRLAKDRVVIKWF